MGLLNLIKWSPWLTKRIYNVLYSNVAKKQLKENKEVLDKLKPLKGSHEGERCFIIGTGPSLRIKDLESLKNEYTFAPNRIFELFDKTDWRPTFYICQDHTIINKFRDQIKSVDCKLSFLPIDHKAEFEGDKFRFFVLREQLFYPESAPFSNDVSKSIGQGYTVTYGAIQMAMYMGFTEIYLLGVDHNYNVIRDAKGRPVKKSNSKINYSLGISEFMPMQNLPRVEESTIAYETAEKASRKKGVRIYNATRGGKLEAFERVNFDNIIVDGRTSD